MKEDYLWDKTGESPEIERMENLLQAFRYQETEPPALPSKVLPFMEKTPRRIFRLAFAACAALMIVAFGIWLEFSSKRIEVAKDSAETVTPKVDEKSLDGILVEKPVYSIVKKVEIKKHSVKRNIDKIRKNVPTKIRQNNMIVRNIVAKKPAVKLTKEEKYAYDQLMLALSITSSKLKLVTDKIDGGEEQNVVLKNER